MILHAAFMSYATFDDSNDEGVLSRIRQQLSREIEAITGQEFPIFQDKENIRWGDDWEQGIFSSLERSTFLIAFITPKFWKSRYCRDELSRFLEKESEDGISGLIFPIYYIKCDQIESPDPKHSDPLVEAVLQRQMYIWVDWRDQGYVDIQQPEARKKIREMAEAIKVSMKRVSHHSECISRCRIHFQNKLDEIFLVNYTYELSPEYSSGLHLFANSLGLSSDLGNKILKSIIRSKEKDYIKSLENLNIESTKLLSNIELSLSNQVFLEVFCSLVKNLNLIDSDPRVAEQKQNCLQEFRRMTNVARMDFRAEFEAMFPQYYHEENRNMGREVGRICRRLRLSRSDADEIVENIFKEFKAQERLKKLHRDLESIVDVMLKAILRTGKFTANIFQRTFMFLFLEFPIIARRLYSQYVIPFVVQEIIPISVHTYNWITSLFRYLKEWIILCLKDFLCPLGRTACSFLKQRVKWKSFLFIAGIISAVASLYSFFHRPRMFLAAVRVDLPGNIASSNALMNGLIFNLTSEWLDSREKIYGLDYNLTLAKSLATGEWLHNIEATVLKLANANEFYIFPQSRVEFIRKIRIDGNSIHVSLRVHEIKELYSVGEKTPKFVSCEYVDSYFRFVFHEGKWKIAQVGYPYKEVCPE